MNISELSYKQVDEMLETIVDHYTLSHVVEMLANIAREKSLHVRENWKNESKALEWGKAACQLDRTQYKIEKLKI